MRTYARMHALRTYTRTHAYEHYSFFIFKIFKFILNLNLIIYYLDKSASNKMLNAAHKLILCGKSKGILREDVRVIGGKQVIATLSPGFELYKQIQNWPEWVSTP